MELLDNLTIKGIDLRKFGFPSYEDVLVVEQIIYDDNDEIYSIFYKGDTNQYTILVPNDQNKPIKTEKIKLSDDEYKNILTSIKEEIFK